MVKRVCQTSDCFIVISISLLEITRKLINRFTRAVGDGDVSELKEMLNVGVPVDSVDELGIAALRWAAVDNRTDVTELLLSKGAEVNKRSGGAHSTALHQAAFGTELTSLKYY